MSTIQTLHITERRSVLGAYEGGHVLDVDHASAWALTFTIREEHWMDEARRVTAMRRVEAFPVRRLDVPAGPGELPGRGVLEVVDAYVALTGAPRRDVQAAVELALVEAAVA